MVLSWSCAAQSRATVSTTHHLEGASKRQPWTEGWGETGIFKIWYSYGGEDTDKTYYCIKWGL